MFHLALKDSFLPITQTNLSSSCHQACNGLLISQTRHAKDSGCSIIWKCPQHGTEIVEIIIPPAPLLQFMNNQINPLLLENLAMFARILSAPVMLI